MCEIETLGAHMTLISIYLQMYSGLSAGVSGTSGARGQLVHVSRQHMYLCMYEHMAYYSRYMCNAEVTSADSSDVFAIENISFWVFKNFHYN